MKFPILMTYLSMKFLTIFMLFLIIIVMEFSTPNDYVFGYLYTGAILLASFWFGRIATIQTTFMSVFLTILNLGLPGSEEIHFYTIANRAIAIVALIITGFLSDRLRLSQDAIIQQQSKLQSQEQLARIREDFVSTLTHDLKTPLLGAIETIKAFQQEKFGAVSLRQQTVLATMARSHSTSLQLVETLLDVYRNDTEGIKLNLAPVDLTILAEDVTSTLRELAVNRRVYFSFNYGDSDWKKSLWVNGDALQLQRVFSNLIVNAINHSRRGERIEIILQTTSSYQVVKIVDRGAGIQSEEFVHLFTRFYQGISQGKGSGLGLYLSRQIIEAHDGTIWAENRLPHGAIFAFKLPILPN
ncbi:HAMP domain-containing histidine kinase [Dolichospermum sp. LEGE 00240]|nr:HAMP domain-containing sensor histidine kinase [Aphanizomenon sp. CS-733/32]MBE9248087.1 HAMP domain-containing histidine kinase [Dolichospermum sp. LEGE 00240]MDM3851583.1 HAMP domain-containing sensor histidine kinase [Aphanizomenon gracile PMC627.10]